MGGLIDQAVSMAHLFSGPRLYVVEMRSLRVPQWSHTIRTRYPSKVHLPFDDRVNAGRRSPSGVLLCALRDDRGSLVVGERTFDKGTARQRV